MRGLPCSPGCLENSWPACAMRVYSCTKCTIDHTSSETSVRSALSSSDAQVVTWGCEPRRALNASRRASRLQRKSGHRSNRTRMPSRGESVISVNSYRAACCSRTLSRTLRCLLLTRTTCTEPDMWYVDRRSCCLGLCNTTVQSGCCTRCCMSL